DVEHHALRTRGGVLQLLPLAELIEQPVARVLLDLAQRREIDHADTVLLERRALDDRGMRFVTFRREEPLDGLARLAARDDGPAALLAKLGVRIAAQRVERGRNVRVG